MPRQLARLFGFPFCRARPARGTTAFTMNEVSEHQGVLLVRLGRGSAMQVRYDPERSCALFRIVPISKVSQLNGDAAWRTASEAQLQDWIDSDSALGRWVLSKGLARENTATAGGGWLLSAL